MTESLTKKVLIVQYSQTGQLSSVARAVAEPLIASELVDVQVLNIEPENPYPFPWPLLPFLDVFPESVYLDPPAIKPIELDNTDFDLIILAYQVWYLSPSLPITAFLKSTEAKNLLANKPVITLIACRNMWVMAQETVKSLLKSLNAKLIDNIVLVDQGSSVASFFTTPRWMFTGKKNAFWGFPPAGVADNDIRKSSRFGLAIEEALGSDRENSQEPILKGLKAVDTNYSLVQSEKVGYRSFRVWGKILRNVGAQGDSKRKPVLILYLCFLIMMIVSVVPINIILKRILSPFFQKRHMQMKEYYEQPSGSGDERMEQFSDD